ncbi:MAG: hypothetical protein HRU41_15970 [Saprospiraceae bacterium]|nr:hypothetical protein [Saprospiraceae bacterium]
MIQTNNHYETFRFCYAMLCLSLSFAQAQTQSTAVVCQEGDCSPEVLSISLEGPLKASPSPQRTVQYQSAYLKVKAIKRGQRQDPTWEGRYLANELNGKSCLRLNHLEGRFGYEYQQNPEFKRFMDQQESDIEAWKESCFEASRRAVNLQKRLGDRCPEELKEKKKDNGPKNDDLVPTYMKMGQVQGYFDEEGNLIKPLKVQPSTQGVANNTSSKNKSGRQPKSQSSSTAQTNSNTSKAKAPKISKRAQITQLKEKVAQLPLGPAMQQKVGGIKDALGNARPKLGLLQAGMGLLGSRLGAFIPGPTGLIGQIKAG